MHTKLVSEFNADEFRVRLAGLATKESEDTSFAEDYASDLCVIMAKHFGPELDRKTLWGRISSGLEVTAARNPNGGPGLLNDAMEHVKAEPGAVARDELAVGLLNVLRSDPAKGRLLAKYLKRYLFVVVALGRQAWQEHKGATS